MELLSGSHTARVYIDGPAKARFQVMDMLAERDLVRNGNDLWLYNSASSAKLLGFVPRPFAERTIHYFRALAETGEIPTTDRQPAARADTR